MVAPKQRGNPEGLGLDLLDVGGDLCELDLGGDPDGLGLDDNNQTIQKINITFSRGRDGETDRTWRRWQQSTTIQPSTMSQS